MPSGHHMEQKTLIEASCTNNMHTEEKVFCTFNFLFFAHLKFVSAFFSDRVRKLVIYIGLY